MEGGGGYGTNDSRGGVGVRGGRRELRARTQGGVGRVVKRGTAGDARRLVTNARRRKKDESQAGNQTVREMPLTGARRVRLILCCGEKVLT